MLKNLEGIYIEESLADPYSVGHRYRYTLAHEIGHRIFHGEIIKSLPFKYVGEYAECMRNINPKTYSRMEYQAYFFAGFLMVPSDLLKSEFQKISVSLKDEGYDSEEENYLFYKYLIDRLKAKFQISGAVLEKRIAYEGINLR